MDDKQSARDFRWVALFIVSLITYSTYDFTTVRTEHPILHVQVESYPSTAYFIGECLVIVLAWSIVVFLVAPFISRLVCALANLKAEVVEVVIYLLCFYFTNRDYFQSAGFAIP